VDPGASSQRAGGIGRAYVFFQAQLTQPGPDNETLDLVRIEIVLRLLLDLVDGPHSADHAFGHWAPTVRAVTPPFLRAQPYSVRCT
jgi:hypothetical protein